MSLFDNHMGVTSLMWFSNKETCMMTLSNFQEFVILQNSFWNFFFYSNIRNLLICYYDNSLSYFNCFYLTLSVLWINGLSPFIKLLFSLNQYMYIKSWIVQTIWTLPFLSKEKLTYGIMNIIFQIHYVTVLGLVLDFATLKSIFLASSGVLTYMLVQYGDVDWSTLGPPTNMCLKTSDMYLSTNKVLLQY